MEKPGDQICNETAWEAREGQNMGLMKRHVYHTKALFLIRGSTALWVLTRSE